MATSRLRHDYRVPNSVRPDSAPRRVLVVDADYGCQLLIADVLMDGGFTPLFCPSVDEAAEVICQTRPDAVIVDPWLGPGQTAVPVLEQVKADPALRAIPLILCSADNAILRDHADTWQRYRCQVVPKPFNVDVLLDAVHVVLSDCMTGDRDRHLAVQLVTVDTAS